MADARALLRAHRVENRVKHPYATYSDAGKLLCKLCREAVKAESLWDAHIRGKSHREKVQALQQERAPNQDEDDSAHKRKRSEDGDEPMLDGDADQDTARIKRSKTDAPSHITMPDNAPHGTETNKEKDKERIHTPPGLARRASGTPSQGVEIAIPSRPATPLASYNSAVSTPKAILNRPPFGGSDSSSNSAVSAPPVQPRSTSIPNETLGGPAQGTTKAPSTGGANARTQDSSAVDETEWAAFEAEMSALNSAAPETTSIANGPTSYSADAIISAPALTAAQIAAKSQEEEHERRKHAAEAEMADEKEEATRALENEFEEMEELEGRVRRLKERREMLRKESLMNLRGAAPPKTGGDGKENAAGSTNNPGRAEDIEEEEDEDDDEDEFDGFRFRV
ncbi:hypothetical protein GGS20DRAFT_533309 [Poronia punctata]|nr:hypothetical protein GGS20DRAFT_533309 [Poronia punctata]